MWRDDGRWKKQPTNQRLSTGEREVDMRLRLSFGHRKMGCGEVPKHRTLRTRRMVEEDINRLVSDNPREKNLFSKNAYILKIVQ